jgi:hypothetical protein
MPGGEAAKMAARETGVEGVAQFREAIKNKYKWSQP